MADEIKTVVEGTLSEVIKRIEQLAPEDNQAEKYQQVFDGEHDILNRPNKKVVKDGKETYVEVAKTVLDYHEDVVESAVAFLFGAPVTINKISEGGDEAFQALTNAIEDMHFNSRCKELARKLFIQTRAAKLYYIKNPDDKEKRKVASMVLSADNGTFIPVFEKGTMTAFLRQYKVKEFVEGKAKEVEKAELYTADKITYGLKTQTGWEEKTIPNPFKKIPVVFYKQKFPEWYKVESIIKAQEMSYSKLIDTNDYFAKPKLTISGKVKNLPSKGEVGEVLEMEIIDSGDGSKVESKAQYLTWDQRPESLKLQFELAEKFIYQFTRTADVNFLSMSKANIGNLSGVALQMLMLAPIIKSLNKQELFDEMLKREINVIMSMLSTVGAKYEKDFKEMKISITFNSVLPDSISEVIQDLVIATSGGIMSKETAIERNPMVDNVETEKERLKEEDNNPLRDIAEPEV